MHVIGAIRRDMVMAMVACPPQRTPLRAGSSEHRKGKLACSARLERAMRKISMVPPRDREHAKEVKRGRYSDGRPTPSYPEHTQTHHMNSDKRHAPQPIDTGRTLYPE